MMPDKQAAMARAFLEGHFDLVNHGHASEAAEQLLLDVSPDAQLRLRALYAEGMETLKPIVVTQLDFRFRRDVDARYGPFVSYSFWAVVGTQLGSRKGLFPVWWSRAENKFFLAGAFFSWFNRR